ncbi:WD40-repeat-containing domain protein [Thamnocephalis sphaerospora]|uniref:WD40-repeat-containing domain protein n=1 Tax=Thamnocephalis sphaerospora TaxID=78915 RepID=A0A4P9XLV3_9FUNG|nr:WD40-repeat-containing domain protein [Thamnocephalis sphaerospora]|eukprot:RKP06240.1 WD40-repeat-containing domain protein [Thamnocephalis sphaerospora]
MADRESKARAGLLPENHARVSNGSDSEESDDTDIDGDSIRLPATHEIKLSGHTRAISALSVEPSGSRVATGSYDGMLRLWDFNGMDSSCRAFRSIEPCEASQVKDVHFSVSGDQLLVAPATCQAKIYDRSGSEIAECTRGDMYMRDLRHTKGHITTLNCCAWHPLIRETFITGATDGTFRIWDVNQMAQQKSIAVYRPKGRAARVPVTALTYSPDGSSIACATQDGVISIWSASGALGRPAQTIEGAHTPGTETSCLLFSGDKQTFVSRGGDGTVKLWDMRSLKAPLAEASGLQSTGPESNVCFSPDEQLILTGKSMDGKQKGRVAVLDRRTLKTVHELAVSDAGVTKVLWHKRINQIIVGCSNGQVPVLYDPELSVKGAILCAGREPKRRTVDDMSLGSVIITPHALPMFRDQPAPHTKRQKEKMRKDPRISKRPDLPVSGPGRGGRIGSSMQGYLMKDSLRDEIKASAAEDPREALLKYAKIAEEEPMFVGHAYKKNQPKPIFDNTQEDAPREMKRRQ